ncbi:c-type cytochrome biogenesis protein CcmI [Tateyamaria pelophila]|uniref:c-type cytochrome biogenesis protein CcmI n=1 Tax=Tateyamaria pelophila TaxID=328415 RepID=UPI001CBE0451|nr:c-type cytochrome biogenesis protein CcmI [Tateyamaria pelophila]
MLFWSLTAVLTLLVAGTLSVTLLRGRKEGRPPASYDLDVYRDQLKEVERDLARGVVSEADAERARTEVSRRILAADAALGAENSMVRTRGGLVTAGLTSLLVAGGAYFLYLELGAPGYGDLALADRIERAEVLRAERPSQETAEAGLPPSMTGAAPASPDYVALVEQLRETVATRPNDLQGHILLVQSEAQLGNFAAAHAAKARVIELKGASATATDFSDYADLLILAAGGYVSPAAEAVLERALAMDPTNGTASYYFGLMMAQTGRPDTALRVWDQLLRAGPPDAPWIPPIEAQIEDIAVRAGVNYARPTIGTGRGPSAEDIEAAGEMSPAERMEMIQGMVSGLSDRLATEGGPVEDWARLISALGVLGQMGQARSVFENAKVAFEGDPRAADILNEAADRVGLQ